MLIAGCQQRTHRVHDSQEEMKTLRAFFSIVALLV